jgi:hypothetical protein
VLCAAALMRPSHPTVPRPTADFENHHQSLCGDAGLLWRGTGVLRAVGCGEGVAALWVRGNFEHLHGREELGSWATTGLIKSRHLHAVPSPLLLKHTHTRARAHTHTHTPAPAGVLSPASSCHWLWQCRLWLHCTGRPSCREWCWSRRCVCGRLKEGTGEGACVRGLQWVSTQRRL